MPPIYPSTALKNQQREIKKLADTQLVYITENGRGKYVFTSEEVLDRVVSDAVEKALYEQRLSDALAESRGDFDCGRYFTSRESLMDAVNAKRQARA
jgi:PHD/YefM family antitoxin component YafN of YafNO toxin-antitoxin module